MNVQIPHLEDDPHLEDEISVNKPKLIIHDSFNRTIKALKNTKIVLPSPQPFHFDPSSYERYESSGRIISIGEPKIIELNGLQGDKICKEKLDGNERMVIAAYDESINSFNALEGVAYFTSHCIIFIEKEMYVPTTLLTMYFYTKSEEIHQKSPCIRLSSSIETDSQIDRYRDKIELIKQTVPKNSILLIDGPLIAGDAYTTFIPEIEELCNSGIVPIFFVKNSDSNMVVNNDENLRKKFNSDLHWANTILKPGQSTNFFEYTDPHNKRNTKVFCYLKAFQNSSPVRVEFLTRSFHERNTIISPILNLIYYLILIQGNASNPQIRPIAIAEKFARSTLGLVNFEKVMKSSGLQPIMDQERGFIHGVI